MSEIEKITGSSPEAKSLDITQQNVEQLKQLFPDVFSENKIDFEALRGVLGEEIDDSEERYNFTWNGKTKARQIAQTPSTGTLRPCIEESVNWDTTENLFIEGDNLEVLKLLQKSYHKKVKMIYIDPPYNTGKDFVYKDDFHDNIQNYLEQTGQIDNDGNKLSTNSDTSGRYHSNWLNMMYPRIKLARNLLTDDGVIAVSIGSDEFKNTVSLLEDLFGEDNCITILTWEQGRKNDSTFFSESVDYIVLFAKNRGLLASKGVWRDKKEGIDKVIDHCNLLKEQYGQNYSLIEDKMREFYSQLESSDPVKKLKHFFRVDERGLFFGADISSASTSIPDYEIYHPVTGKAVKKPSRGWGATEPVMLERIKDNKVLFGLDENTIPLKKSYLLEVDSIVKTPVLYKDGRAASRVVKDLFDGVPVFNNPKDHTVLSDLIAYCTQGDKESLILDFFAGSSSTAHAVLNLNKDDSGQRRFIMVQLPELCNESSPAYKSGYNIISEISRERIRRVLKQNSHMNAGFKAFSLSETNIRPWDADFDNLELVLQQAAESIKEGRSSEDVLYEIFLKYGYDLTTPVDTETVNGKQVFVVGAGALIVCLDDEITGETVEGIAKLKEELDPETTQVVFKDAGFADSNVKTNAIQILKQAGIDDVKSI